MLLLSTVTGVVFGLLVYRLHFLNGTGSVAGSLLATTLVLVGGWAWLVPSFTFFLLSSLLSHFGRRGTTFWPAYDEKGHVRDAGQVYANGGVGWMLLLIYGVYPLPVFYWGFLGAFAAAAADTFATELGVSYGREPRLILSGRRVPRGTSGAVSMVGSLGALAGAGCVALSAWPFGGSFIPESKAVLMIGFVTIGGFISSFVDSTLGMTVQAHYVDTISGRETERSGIDGKVYKLVRGRPWVTNDRVNLLATLFGAAFALVVSYFTIPVN